MKQRYLTGAVCAVLAWLVVLVMILMVGHSDLWLMVLYGG